MPITRYAVLAVGIAGIMSVSGCAPTTPPPPTATATPTPTATATPPPATSAPDAANCENLLDAATLDTFTANALALTPPDEFGTRMRAEGQIIAAFVDNGGVLCQWGPAAGFEATEIYGFSPIDATQAATVQARLAAEGLVRGDHRGAVTYSDTTSEEGVVFEYLFVDGFWFCAVSFPRILEIVGNAPI